MLFLKQPIFLVVFTRCQQALKQLFTTISRSKVTSHQIKEVSSLICIGLLQNNQSLNSRKSTVPKKNLNVINNIVDREIKRQRRSRNDRDDEYGVISEKDDFDSS